MEDVKEFILNNTTVISIRRKQWIPHVRQKSMPYPNPLSIISMNNQPHYLRALDSAVCIALEFPKSFLLPE
jgi:hypothetical protein